MDKIKYSSGLVKVVEAHLVLGGLSGLKYNGQNKTDRAITNNLEQMSQHATEKRFSQGEIYQKTNLLALCQYEFMLKKMLNYVKSPLIKVCMEKAIEKIEDVRRHYNCPPFKEKDEVMIVETIYGDKVKAIDPEKLERFKGKFNRLLPIEPRMRFETMDKGMGGFLNYNGHEKETVEYVMNNIEDGEC